MVKSRVKYRLQLEPLETRTTPSVTVTQSGGSTDFAEGGTADTFTMVLTSAPTSNVTITVTPDSQVNRTPSYLVFTPATWSTPQTVYALAVDDLVVEGPHTGTFTFTVSSTDPAYSGLAVAPVVANITDNDATPGVTIIQSSGSTDLAEGGTADTYSMALTSAPTANVTITVTPNSQVTRTPSYVVFTPANWSTPQTVYALAVDDAVVEGAHTGAFTHTVSSTDAAYNGITVASVIANITDNDTAAGGVTVTQSGGSTDISEGGTADTFTMALTSAPTANVTITIVPDSQLTRTPSYLVFTTANWSTPQTVYAVAVDDAVVEGPHTGTYTFTVSSTDPAYSGLAVAPVVSYIADNDTAPGGVTITQSGGATNVAEGGTADTFTMVLTSAPTANVTITIVPDSQVIRTPAYVVFTTANWSTPQPVYALAVDDAIVEGPHSGTFTFTVSSTDPAYSGLAVTPVVANITDNDTAAGIAITQSGGSTDITEGGVADTFTMVLTSAPTANVTITVTADSQVTRTPAYLVFTPANWNSPQTVYVVASNDTVVEGPHTGTLTFNISSTDAGYNALVVAPVVANVTDNDFANVIVSRTTGPISMQEGQTQSYTMVLNRAPSAPVTVDAVPQGDIQVTPSTVVFTPSNWNVPQPVYLQAYDNSTIEGLHQAKVTHTLTSTDPLFGAVSVPDINADIIDNDGYLLQGTGNADKILVAPSADGMEMLVTINNQVTHVPVTVPQVLLQLGTGNDVILITTPNVPLTILGGSGKDNVYVIGANAGSSFDLGMSSLNVNGVAIGLGDVESLAVSGKTGPDTFSVSAMPLFPVVFKGDLGDDTLIGPNYANTWAITAANGGTLNKTIAFATIENLTGGSGYDTFVFSSAKGITGLLDGGAGTNVLDYSLYQSAVTVNLQSDTTTGTASFRNFSYLLGGKNAADRLIGLDQNNLWNITGKNTGTVGGFAFKNVENLSGGSFDDSFRLVDNQGLTGKIDGGGGIDVLDYASYLTKAVSLNLQAKTATNLGGFLNLESFLGGSGADTLIGWNLANTWGFNAPGGGYLSASTLTGGTVSALFGNFENFVGGSLADTFSLGAAGDWRGLLYGGSGNDTLNAYAGTGYYTGSTTGTLNGRKFSSIETRL